MSTLKALMQDFLTDWRDDIATPWQSFLDGIEPALDMIDPSLTTTADEVVFPGRKGREPQTAPIGSHLFRALEDIAPSQVRVVIIGQDPYPRVSRATGRAFEQGDLASWDSFSPRVANSLKRIIQQSAAVRSGNDTYSAPRGGWRRLVKDIKSDALQLDRPQQLFTHWQSQGVLFLNTGLTLTRYKQGGHPHQLRGHIPLWAPVVGAICSRLAQSADTPVVFLCWGKEARKFLRNSGIITRVRRPVSIAPNLENTGIVDRNHPAAPSFLSGENVFRETNHHLEALGGNPISW